MIKHTIQQDSNRTIIFQKNQVLGRTKTRISNETNVYHAFSVYRTLVRTTQELFTGMNFNPVVYYSDFVDTNDAWIKVNAARQQQAQVTDLGERMLMALKNELELYKYVLIIGSDCPYLDSDHLKLAFDNLRDKDFVIGPTKDGGFYLLGLKILFPTIFDGIEWSTETVCSLLEENIRKQHYSYHLLERLSDIDHESDWKLYLTNIEK